MLKITGLRIGNIYRRGGAYKAYKVKDYHGIMTAHCIGEGIPLTSVWLKKLGFNDTGDNLYFKSFAIKNTNDSVMVNIDFAEPTAFIQNFRQDKETLTTVKFPRRVHELQNLVYALTGNEIKVSKKYL